MTMVGHSPLAGAVMTTFLAPAVRCPLAFSTSVNRPVDSITTSTPNSFQGNWEGSLALTTLIFLPLTTSTSASGRSAVDFSDPMAPLKRPWMESYFRRYARLSAGTISPTATTSTSFPTKPCSTIARNTRRPMRPNPLIATLTAIIRFQIICKIEQLSISPAPRRSIGKPTSAAAQKTQAAPQPRAPRAHAFRAGDPRGLRRRRSGSGAARP